MIANKISDSSLINNKKIKKDAINNNKIEIKDVAPMNKTKYINKNNISEMR